ncbi:MAG: anhydro-N-acetylmuramic acid kinase [Alphaproteobacteria bacterium]|nr:anhydro-N-acetylmuramic acid kinase [Alphaproteobacteria bacterium]MCL2504831.1 anhydro-N-acetylmuramic acid kinase [Alphaproteobacteria bacterium]
MQAKLFNAIGLMSGTSLDGIDAAFIATDGFSVIERRDFIFVPYPADFKQKLRSVLGNSTRTPEVLSVEKELTGKHALAISELMKRSGVKPDIIGFHGQTLFHDISKAVTFQIGDGRLLASLTGVDVVNDFRSNDVKAGGNGAPLVPLFHQALMSSYSDFPIIILNIGGVSNITWLNTSDILACDVGPGNALLDDWVLASCGKPFDENGSLAASGKVDYSIIESVLSLQFFKKPPPKSLDRNDFSFILAAMSHLSPEDGAATLTMLSAQAFASVFDFLPERPVRIFVCGGGSHNGTMLRFISDVTGIPVSPLERSDEIEAQAFAWLAVRSLLGLPISMPSTTGVPFPLSGGTLHRHG